MMMTPVSLAFGYNNADGPAKLRKPKLKKPRRKALLDKVSVVGAGGRFKSDVLSVGPNGELTPTPGFVDWVSKRMANQRASVEISGFHHDPTYPALLSKLYTRARQGKWTLEGTPQVALGMPERVVEFMAKVLTGVKASPRYPKTPPLVLNGGAATASAELIADGYIDAAKREARMKELSDLLNPATDSSWGKLKPKRTLSETERDALQTEFYRLESFGGQLGLDSVLNRAQRLRVDNRGNLRVPPLHLDSSSVMINDWATPAPAPLLGLYYGVPENLSRTSGVELYDVGRALGTPRSTSLTSAYEQRGLPFALTEADTARVQAFVDPHLPEAKAARLVQLPRVGGKILLIPNGDGHIAHASADYKRLDDSKGVDKPFYAVFA
jgi:hypothetical protein